MDGGEGKRRDVVYFQGKGDEERQEMGRKGGMEGKGWAHHGANH